MSGLARFGVFLSILFFYPKTQAYWTNILTIFTKYVNWTHPGLILSYIALGLLLFKQIYKNIKKEEIPYLKSNTIYIVIGMLASNMGIPNL